MKETEWQGRGGPAPIGKKPNPPPAPPAPPQKIEIEIILKALSGQLKP